ncbi:probable protein S-acyltransferase 16 isoform X4 [Physcomitrium patens]|uniref:probable protein S-acyltransferase 16 isoform X4 n=1 Tax=Physcomitrium patens TaxID=3218 RepID=UPI003CCD1BC7
MKRLMGILLHMKTLMPGRRREPLLLHRQFGRGCCSSDRWSVSYLWNSFVMKFQARLDYSVQVAGPLYILLAFSLISSVIYLFLVSILPAVYPLSSWQGIAHLLVAGWLAFNVFFNYFCCICTDPGSSPIISDTVMPLARYEMDLEGADYAPSRWCKRCRKPKPPMTHHCHICKRCILKMDHHCPWMHNCIGYYNYRFFFVFLLYMWAGCLYAAVMSSLPMFGPEDEDDGEENGVGILFTFILSVAVLISLTFLLGWHIYLVLTAQTTIDFYGNRQRRKEARANGESWTNVYDLGKLQNLRQVTDVGGSYWWLWLLLPTRALPKGDGCNCHFHKKLLPIRYNALAVAQGLRFLRYFCSYTLLNSNSLKQFLNRYYPCLTDYGTILE